MDPFVQMAAAYQKLLTSVDWDDPLLIAGLREGLNKFLSNAHLALFRGQNKYHKTHFVSVQALEQLQKRQHSELTWEHLVPKDEYIQKPCERLAAQHALSVGSVEELLRMYWKLATITNEENRLLSAKRMSSGWDGKNVLARYEAVGVELVRNPFFEVGRSFEPEPHVARTVE